MRNGSSTSLTGWQPGDPTPEDIAAITADIRTRWSEREHYVRAGRRVPVHLATHSYYENHNTEAIEVQRVGSTRREPVVAALP